MLTSLRALAYHLLLLALTRATPFSLVTRLNSTAKGEDGAYQRFERGECSLSEFYDDWGRELNDLPRGNAAYKAYAQRRGLGVCSLQQARVATDWSRGRTALPRLPESLNIDVREVCLAE